MEDWNVMQATCGQFTYAYGALDMVQTDALVWVRGIITSHGGYWSIIFPGLHPFGSHPGICDDGEGGSLPANMQARMVPPITRIVDDIH